jgi:hypothetical protein
VVQVDVRDRRGGHLQCLAQLLRVQPQAGQHLPGLRGGGALLDKVLGKTDWHCNSSGFGQHRH